MTPAEGTRALGPTSMVLGAAGGGGWVLGRCVAAWEFPHCVGVTEGAWGWTDLLPAPGWHRT